MGILTPEFHDVIVALFGADFDPKTIHETSFRGDPHNKDEARWHGRRLSGRMLRDGRSQAPGGGENHFICMGKLDPGSTGRSLANVTEHVAIWMDDVGTKVPAARVSDWMAKTGLKPALIVHTSPGNYSYHWALNVPVKEDGGFDAQTVAAIRHRLKTDGWGDPAAQDGARYMRSGFGVNGKKKYAGGDGSPFKVEIALFDPDAKVSLWDFAEAIMGPGWQDEVKSGKYLTSAQIALHNSTGSADRRATMDMPLVKLAAAVGLDPQPSTRAGVIDCRCPNEAAHTGGDPTGYAIINDGMSFCNHASCQHLNSADFQGLMIERYNSQIEAGKLFGQIVDNPFGPGLIDAGTGEFVNETGSGFLAAARFASAPGPDGMPETVAEVAAAAEELAARQEFEEELRVEERDALLDKLYKRFVYVDRAEAFWDRDSGELVSPSRFDRDEDVLRLFKLNKNNRAANQVLNEVGRMQHVATLIQRPYRPDRPPNTDIVILDDGSLAVNTFRPTRIGFRQGVPTKFLAHLDFLYGSQPEVRKYLLEFMAFCVQFPEVKTSIVPLIGGAPGIGKDAHLLQPLFRLLGLHNVARVSASKLSGDFNEFLRKPVIAMGEFSLAGRDGKRAYDRLKDLTSPDPVPVSINPKYGKTFETEVSPKFIATTNDEDAVQHVTMDDRRFFIAWSEAVMQHGGTGKGPGSPAYYEDLTRYFEDIRNLEVLHFYLMNLPITVFHPHKYPPRTAARHETLVSSLQSVQRFVYDLVTDGEFAGRKVVTYEEVEAKALGSNNNAVKNNVYPKAIAEGLAAAGCRKIDRASVSGKRVQLWTGSSVVLGNGKTYRGSLDTAEQKVLLGDKQIAIDTLLAEQKAAADALARAG